MAAERPRRNLDRVNYNDNRKELAYVGEKQQNASWSTSTFFPINVVDEKEEDDIPIVLVHYIGWSNKFDEWKPISEILHTPNEFIISSPEATACFYKHLSISIKENLNIRRSTDSLVEIRSPITKQAYEPIKLLGVPKSKGYLGVFNLSVLDNLFGKNWHFRIVNSNRDFAYIVQDTVVFKLIERRPLIDYKEDGSKQFIHRGFVLVFKFVKDRGNAIDLNLFLQDQPSAVP